MWSDKPCKLATKNLNAEGYPRTWVNRKRVSLTRLVLEESLGRPIREGYCACHHCDVPACIEPTHLWEGTSSQNQRDSYKKGRKLSGWSIGRQKGE